MSDLISIKSAVEALAELVPYAIDDDVTRAYMDGLTDACNLICQLPPAQPLTDEDYIELHDRFGTYVEEVVRDMISGEGKRWGRGWKT